MSDTATPFLTDIVSSLDSLPPVSDSTADWQTEVRKIAKESEGKDSLAYMRVHFALQEMVPLIQIAQMVTGRDSALVQFYDYFQKQQAGMGDGTFEAILEEAKVYAGVA